MSKNNNQITRMYSILPGLPSVPQLVSPICHVTDGPRHHSLRRNVDDTIFGSGGKTGYICVISWPCRDGTVYQDAAFSVFSH